MVNENSPLRRIRKYCVEICCVGSKHEVKECPITDCPLYDMRFGKNIFRTKRVMTDEQKAASTERLRKSRESKLTEKPQ